MRFKARIATIGHAFTGEYGQHYLVGWKLAYTPWQCFIRDVFGIKTAGCVFTGDFTLVHFGGYTFKELKKIARRARRKMVYFPDDEPPSRDVVLCFLTSRIMTPRSKADLWADKMLRMIQEQTRLMIQTLMNKQNAEDCTH